MTCGGADLDDGIDPALEIDASGRPILVGCGGQRRDGGLDVVPVHRFPKPVPRGERHERQDRSGRMIAGVIEKLDQRYPDQRQDSGTHGHEAGQPEARLVEAAAVFHIRRGWSAGE